VRDRTKPDALAELAKERLTAWAKFDPAWHTRQAAEAEKAGQSFAAAFHLRLLLKHDPENAALKRRLSAVEAPVPENPK
jgi:predicted TPR repeat methyltransferase